MGQAQVQGLQEQAPSNLIWVQGKLQKHASELKQLAHITYDQFLESIQEINKVTQSFSDVNGKQLIFQVKKGTDATIFWKGTVRVRCHKVNCRTGAMETTRQLNLKQYIHLHNEIMQQASMGTLYSEDGSSLTASIIITELEGQSQPDSGENECCICMDRRSEIILGCSHSYCEQCIDEWHVNHKTCPICRATVTGADDTWVLTEKPDTNEMVYETTGYLMGLADRTGVPSKSPNE